MCRADDRVSSQGQWDYKEPYSLTLTLACTYCTYLPIMYVVGPWNEADIIEFQWASWGRWLNFADWRINVFFILLFLLFFNLRYFSSLWCSGYLHDLAYNTHDSWQFLMIVAYYVKSVVKDRNFGGTMSVSNLAGEPSGRKPHRADGASFLLVHTLNYLHLRIGLDSVHSISYRLKGSEKGVRR